VRVPVGQQWELVDMNPTGRRLPAAASRALNAGVELEQTKFDDVFESVFDGQGISTATITDPASGRVTTMRYDNLFKQCVVFNPPPREAVCVEPYTTVPDAFALAARGIDPHLLTIAPGGRLATWFEIDLRESKES
jgi:aldose 1-epimerase